MFRIIFSIFLRHHNSTIRCYDVVLLFFFVSLSSLCFATDEDGCAVEKFCNTLFKCIYNLHEEIFCLIVFQSRHGHVPMYNHDMEIEDKNPIVKYTCTFSFLWCTKQFLPISNLFMLSTISGALGLSIFLLKMNNAS